MDPEICDQVRHGLCRRMIAAEMKIAPWPRKHAFKCIARLYRRALNVVATPEEALADLLHRLAANATSKKRFPVLKKGEALAQGREQGSLGIPPQDVGRRQRISRFIRKSSTNWCDRANMPTQVRTAPGGRWLRAAGQRRPPRHAIEGRGIWIVGKAVFHQGAT